MKVLVHGAVLATVAISCAGAQSEGPQAPQEAILGDFSEEPYRDIASEIKPPVEAVEALREEPVTEAPVSAIPYIEPTVVVFATAIAQGHPATAELAEALVRYFVEQPSKALRVVLCESGGDPTAYSVDGPFYGLWQFTLDTWESVGGVGFPSHASVDEQTRRARILYEQRGWQPWPVCGLS